jgi:hypothetical protein
MPIPVASEPCEPSNGSSMLGINLDLIPWYRLDSTLFSSLLRGKTWYLTGTSQESRSASIYKDESPPLPWLSRWDCTFSLVYRLIRYQHSLYFASTKIVINMRSYFTLSLALAAFLSSVLAGPIDSDSDFVERGE